MEEIIRDSTPFASLDLYIRNQKQFEDAYQALTDQEFEMAIGLFEKVLESNPKHVQSYGNLALAHAALGNKSVALRCVGKALELDPSYKPAIYNRASIKRMKEGQPHLKPILEIEYYQKHPDAKKSLIKELFRKVFQRLGHSLHWFKKV